MARVAILDYVKRAESSIIGGMTPEQGDQLRAKIQVEALGALGEKQEAEDPALKRMVGSLMKEYMAAGEITGRTLSSEESELLAELMSERGRVTPSNSSCEDAGDGAQSA